MNIRKYIAMLLCLSVTVSASLMNIGLVQGAEEAIFIVKDTDTVPSYPYDCCLDETIQYDGIPTAKWYTNGGRSQAVMKCDLQLADYNYLNLQIYSPMITDKTIGVHFSTNLTNEDGKAIYGSVPLTIDWEGWKDISIPTGSFKGNYGSLDGASVTELILWDYGFGYTYNKSNGCTELNLGKIWFEYKEPPKPEPTDENEFDIVKYDENSIINARYLSLDKTVRFDSDASAKWDVSKNNEFGYTFDCNADEYKYIYMMLYSPCISDSQIMWQFKNSKDSSGKYHYSYIKLDFEGWKLISIPVSDIKAENIDTLMLWNYGWTNRIDGIDSLNISRIWFSKYDLTRLEIYESDLIPNYDMYDAVSFNPILKFNARLDENSSYDIFVEDENNDRIGVEVQIDKKSMALKTIDSLKYDSFYILHIEDLRDIYGNTFNTVIRFKTIPAIFNSSVPEIYSKGEKTGNGLNSDHDEFLTITSNADNPTENDEAAIFIVCEYGVDGKLVNNKIYAPVTVSAGEFNKKISVEYTMINNDNKINAFVCNENYSPICSDYAFLNDTDKNSVTATEFIDGGIKDITVDSTGNTYDFSAVFKSPFTRFFTCCIFDKDNKVLSVNPVVNFSDGSIKVSLPLSDNSDDDNYTIYKFMLQNTSGTVYDEEFIYVGEKARKKVTELLNNTSSRNECEDIVKNEYLNLYIDSDRVSDENGAKFFGDVLFRNKPFKSYDEIIGILNKSVKLLKDINTCDWNNFSELILNESKLLNITDNDMEAFRKMTADDRAKTGRELMKKRDFLTFIDFSDAFADIIKQNNADSQKDNSGKISGGSGTGGKSSYFVLAVTNDSNKDGFENDTNENREVFEYFIDLSDTQWAKNYINKLLTANMISKSDDKLFRPNDNITREEFVKMLSAAFGIFDESAKCDFTDADENEWYSKYIASMANAGIITGFGGRFGVGERITRQDMAVMCYRIMLYKNMNTSSDNNIKFLDEADISDYAFEAVNTMTSLNIINGMGDGTFMPQLYATRAQAAKIVALLMDNQKKGA